MTAQRPSITVRFQVQYAVRDRFGTWSEFANGTGYVFRSEGEAGVRPFAAYDDAHRCVKRVMRAYARQGAARRFRIQRYEISTVGTFATEE